MPAAPSLPSRQRARVLETYRSRGHRNSNLWLVYSVKLDQDILFHSDRSLVHWLSFLETDHSVSSFQPIDADLAARLSMGTASATMVDRRGQPLELHVVGSSCANVTTVETSAGVANVRVITVEELQMRSRAALRWLKAIGYAGIYRFRDHAPVLNQLLPLLNQRWTGNVECLVEDLPGIARPAIYAAVVKLAIEGVIDLDLSSHSLCGTSIWKMNLPRSR